MQRSKPIEAQRKTLTILIDPKAKKIAQVYAIQNDTNISQLIEEYFLSLREKINV